MSSEILDNSNDDLPRVLQEAKVVFEQSTRKKHLPDKPNEVGTSSSDQVVFQYAAHRRTGGREKLDWAIHIGGGVLAGLGVELLFSVADDRWLHTGFLKHHPLISSLTLSTIFAGLGALWKCHKIDHERYFFVNEKTGKTI